MELKTFGGEWDADAKSTLTIDAMSPQGGRLLHRSESFRFTKDYPNGKDCEPTVLRHETNVAAGALSPKS